MRLAWSWLQRTSEHCAVDIESNVDQRIDALFDLSAERTVEGCDYCVEDCVDHLRLKVRVGDHIEVTLQTRCEHCSASTWWSHSRNEEHVFNLVERFFLRLAIVPSFVVHELPQKLQWRLGTILFLLWHVHIVNKDCIPFANWWSIDSFPSLVKFLIKVVLSLVG